MIKGDNRGFKRNCSARSVGILKDNLVLSNELMMYIGRRKEFLIQSFRQFKELLFASWLHTQMSRN